MNRKIFLLIGFLLGFGVSMPAYAQDIHQLRPKVACIPFIARNIEAAPFAEGISSMLLYSVAKQGYFEVLERKKVEGALDLEGLKFENLSQQGLLQVGNRAGVDFLISGSVTQTGEGIVIEIQLLNLRLQKICSSERVRTGTDISGKLQEVAAGFVKKAKDCAPGGGPAPASVQLVAPPCEIKISGTAKSIRLQWSHTAPSQVSGYRVYRSSNENGPFSHIATTKEPACADENLRINETFYYRLKALNQVGVEGAFSETVVGKTVLAPHPPILLNLTPDIKSAFLTWRPRPYSGNERDLQVGGFKIYRKAEEETSFKEVARIGKEIASYKDGELKDGTQYSYIVTAVNSEGGESECSSILEIRTIAAQLGGQGENGKIRQVPLKWNAQNQESVEGYLIYRSLAKETGYQKIAKIAGRQTAAHVDSGLQDQTTYWYRITAFNKVNAETDPGEAFSATTRGKPPTPAGLKVRSGEARKVTLQWEPVNSPPDEIKGYLLHRAAENQGPYQKIAEVSVGKNSAVDESPPLNDNSTYFYKISSYNSVNVESLHSEAVSATTKAVPKTPVGLKAASGEVKKVTLTWEQSPESDIKEYVIYRKRPEDAEMAKLRAVKQNSYTDSNLKDGLEYVYTLQAVDQDNLASPPSTPILAKTKPLPQKVAGLKMTESDGKKAISWNASPETDVREYNVYRKNFLGIWQKITSVTSNSWALEGLKGKNELGITARDENGLESELSDPLVAEIK